MLHRILQLFIYSKKICLFRTMTSFTCWYSVTFERCSVHAHWSIVWEWEALGLAKVLTKLVQFFVFSITSYSNTFLYKKNYLPTHSFNYLTQRKKVSSYTHQKTHRSWAKVVVLSFNTTLLRVWFWANKVTYSTSNLLVLNGDKTAHVCVPQAHQSVSVPCHKTSFPRHFWHN